jgi:GTP-binding protein LepA
MNLDHIRNFSIIAHIDHGKSTLADRMLELTGTVEKRKMQDQVLDSMELEREKGITIKMTPARMDYKYKGEDYVLNLIDTPGHIDFSYEVSRALKAVEGSILLVDAAQGVQAQTLTTLEMARKMGLVIIPVLSKVDSPNARIDDIKIELAELLDCDLDDVIETSGKTGFGVDDLLQTIIDKVPAPHVEMPSPKDLRALVFDFQYSNHQGVIVYTRIFDGEVVSGSKLRFKIAGESFITNEVGIFSPAMEKRDKLTAGETGYIVTGIKRPGVAKVGDTIVYDNNPIAELPGYEEPKPVVWASIFPESQDEFDMLRTALERLKLSDSSYVFEEESSGTLGRGFRCGFLGMLHLEIITERLMREFNLELVVTLPTINYLVKTKGKPEKLIYSPTLFPDHGEVEWVKEPWVNANIMVPSEYVGTLMQVLYIHEATVTETHTVGGRQSILFVMPLRELMRNFFDEIKSASSGYASLSYEIGEFKDANVTKMEVLVGEEVYPAFTRMVATIRVDEEAQKTVEKLFNILPRQMITTKIQAKVNGRIIASKTLSALKKNVTAHMYGGDITRKKKLLEKQKKGKKKMQKLGKINITNEVFLKMMRGGEGE